MKRSPDLLDRYLAAERHHGFEWGRRNDDCMLFLAGWAHVATGVDHGAPWRGFYHDEPGARALVEVRGGMEAVMDAAFGQRALTPARRGDIGLCQLPDGTTGMICTGRMWAARRKLGGVAYMRLQPFAHWGLDVSACPAS